MSKVAKYPMPDMSDIRRWVDTVQSFCFGAFSLYTAAADKNNELKDTKMLCRAKGDC